MADQTSTTVKRALCAEGIKPLGVHRDRGTGWRYVIIRLRPGTVRGTHRRAEQIASRVMAQHNFLGEPMAMS